jgi:hypothetical protein
MEYSGLFQKYKLNRLLTDEEKALQLKQQEKLGITPHYLMSTIKLNSTYLEIADKYYGMRGWLSLGMLVVSAVCILFIGLFGIGTIQDWDNTVLRNQQTEAVVAGLVACGLLAMLLAVAIWVLRKEAFWLTHLPARLNRKTRMVHLFRPDRSGSILSAHWDSIFFTLGRGQTLDHWDVRGHILATDGRTVVETFSLGAPWSNREELKQHWEYMRRYMEEGPQSIMQATVMCLPIAHKRESWLFGLQRLLLVFPGSIAARTIGLPIFLQISVCRVFANWTSRIPEWPADIEATCAIEVGDFYERDERMNIYNRWGWLV